MHVSQHWQLVNEDFVHELTQTEEVLFSEMGDFVATSGGGGQENVVNGEPDLGLDLA